MFSDQLKSEFHKLFSEFVHAYLSQEQGKKHLSLYEQVRTQGRKNFDDIVQKMIGGALPTDDVLKRLLPHTDSAAHRESGAWIHNAPAIQGTIQGWYSE